jgi:hypothetical protein
VKRFRRGFLVLSALALAVVGLVVTLGAGGERQFCPATLEHRGVAIYTVPYIGIVVWSSPYEPERLRIVRFWYDEGYARAGGPPERWHLVTSWVSWRRFSGSGRAKMFWHMAGCQGDEDAEEWIAWSRRHPALAADLWPRVVSLLHRAGTEPVEVSDPYWEAMILMGTVRGAESEGTYRKRIATWERRCAEERAK